MAAVSNHSARTQSILGRLIKLPKCWTDNPARELLHEGIIMMEEDRKLKPRWCLLFNDIFLMTKPQCEFTNNETQLADPNTQLKFKNFLFLRSCYIDESPKTVKSHSHCKHNTYPFVLTGENPLNHRQLHISMSCKNIHERHNWLKLTHRAIIKIHQSTFNDFERYAWENVYRRGTLFHAMYNNDIKLLNTLIDGLTNQNNNNNNNNNNNKKNNTVNNTTTTTTNTTNPTDIESEMKDAEFDRQRRGSIMATKIESLLDEGGHNLLHIAAYTNNVDFIKTHGSRFSVDLPDQNGWTALRIACDNSHYKSISALINLNANVEECYPEDRKANPYIRKAMHERTLLHEFTQRGNMTIVKMLLNCNVDIETCDAKGLTPLHLACREGNELITLLLLRNGAPTNLPDFLTNRPLHLTKDENVGRWLVAYGARPELTNMQGQPASMHLGQKLDKYKDIYATLGPELCEIQGEAVDENAWFDDKLSDACLACKDKFTMRNRRHHCRKSGLLVCGACSAKKLSFIGKDGKECLLRASDKAYNIAHTQSTKMTNNQVRPCDDLAQTVMDLTEIGSYNTSIYSYDALSKMPDIDNDSKMDDEKTQSHGRFSGLKNRIHGSQRSETFAAGKNNNNNNKNKANKSNKNHEYSKTAFTQTKQETKNAKDLISQANAKALERGDKLNQLADKSEQLADSAKNFNDMAKQLAKKKW